MALPWVVLTDPFETQDILLRRTKEFDRSGFFGDLINGILPEQHIQFLSTDERFKRNRNLINHLMAPTFISQVSAPEVYLSTLSLIELWKLKCDFAQGRPFFAHNDITALALDSIFASTFGLPSRESNMHHRHQMMQQYGFDNYSRLAFERPDSEKNEIMEFPETPEVPEIFSAVLTLANSVTDTQLSPAPRLTSWVIRKFPYMRKATAIKDAYIRRKTDECIALIKKGDRDSAQPRSALHSVLLRERDVAAKEGRAPAYRRRGIADEFFGFMTAGFDTSATTLAWGVKNMADNQRVQGKLRKELRAALPDALKEERCPTYSELLSIHVPYLDAVVEEVLRHANTIAFVVRRAQVDTTVLGRHIPKGTDVFLMANGPGYLEPNIPVSDAERSAGAREGKTLTGKWEDADTGAFRPERWLKTDGNTGEVTFDSKAGPTLPFGLGPRACFGKRLALQELKLQFALLVWHFELRECPESLSGYDAVQKFAREPTSCYVRLSKVFS